MKPTIEKPKVFISYAWGSREYQERVVALARDLVDDGIDVLLDKWNLKEGHDTYAYMEQSVNNADVTNVLILLDPLYARKANERSGGVGTETQIISPEIYNKVTQEKFLPIVMERGEDDSIPKPSFLKALLHFDLSKPEHYDDEYKRLVKRLYGVEIIRKPVLGKMPCWVTEESAVPSSARAAISAIKQNVKAPERRNNYVEFLNTLKKKICEFDSSTGDYLELYLELKAYRDEYLHSLKVSTIIEDAHKLIGDFLQEIYYDINTISDPVPCKDIKQVLLHEMFVYTIAHYCKLKEYYGLEYLMNRTYFGTRYRKDNQEIGLHIFYHYSQTMNSAKNINDDKNYHSGTAQFWIENIATELCSKKEFVFADVLICNYSLYGKNYHHNWPWFPITYVYSGENETIFQKLASSFIFDEIASTWMRVFGYNQMDEFKKKIAETNERIMSTSQGRPRYNQAFYGVQLIGDFTKPDDIGKYR